MIDQTLYGLILAGGKSTRMGQDKSLLDYHGKPQVEHLAEMLNQFCSEVFISCKEGKEPVSSLTTIHDQFDFESPLNGLLSAFKKHSHKAWLTVPVDMPLIDEEILQELILHRNKSRPATCFLDSTGNFPEPLLAIWESGCYSSLLEFHQQGGVSLREFLIQQQAHFIPVSDPKYLLNINSIHEREWFIKSYIKND